MMSKVIDWRICPNCSESMLPIHHAPELSWGCMSCGEAWNADEAQPVEDGFEAPCVVWRLVFGSDYDE
jgi:ribosomal protein S27AE